MPWPPDITPPRFDAQIEETIKRAWELIARGNLNMYVSRLVDDGLYKWETKLRNRGSAPLATIELYFDGQEYHAVIDRGPRYQPGMASHGAFQPAIASALRQSSHVRPEARTLKHIDDAWSVESEARKRAMRNRRSVPLEDG